MSCGVGFRLNLDPTLLWLWCRLAAAALIQPLAWELPYAAGVALKRKKKKGLNRSYGTLQARQVSCIKVAGKER